MFEEISARIRENFEVKDSIREEGLKISREVVRECRTASFALHNQDFEKADKSIKAAGEALEKLKVLFKGHADIYHAGFVEHAQQEYAEVSVLSSLFKEDKNIPSPDDLRVEYAAYLNGLGDVVGELRRHVLDLIRDESFEKAETFLGIMENIHAMLMDFDYPDAITRGLRRKTDVSRSLLEKTRGDVVNAIGQKKLETAMHNLESRL
ncbi:translin [Methanosarcina thermophila]|jgi:translin|uniref:Translin n=3 Tax=Methanosarcina thermophila TaxID=2210 RepID=A0A1I6ZJM1_METTE|nr:haloacid dehalogenase [Methanosarcina thermophila]ALK04919.1 MAG: haloacid dehalogenase [Methanosarcina sp. 795]AKB13642.1 haloacid dehalogenase superfamily protein [Methanosarcina thermophila TM-1]AKB15718.1 haloacid dehalogenase superfamily protein [Methanosarcina thermophila CHTI-55]NLU58016.1 haloacid dehalogenase [Methanosarcina thermophila]SFT62882.1 translin [Methanosarcina thermophila]